MSDKAIRDWAKVCKKRFDGIKNKVQIYKNNNLQARPFCKLFNVIESNKLI